MTSRSVSVALAFVITSLVIGFYLPGTAQGISSADSTKADAPLCLPYGSADWYGDCALAGPAARLDSLAEMGITFPEKPIYADYTPYELSFTPFSYARTVNEEIPLYATLEDVEKRKPTNTLAAGAIKYVSLINKSVTGKGTYYQIATTEWISAEYITKVGAPNFQGFLFKKNPDFIFGWMINETSARSAPDPYAPETGKKLWRTELVHVYDSKMVGDTEWVMVGPDQWIEHRNVARVVLNVKKPEGVTTNRWIEVNLYEQVLSVYEDDKLLFSTLISSGVNPFFTQPGVFQITEKLEHDVMYGTFEADRSDYYYLEDVPYIMYYDQRRALHGAYWQSLLGYQRSHGCVNLSVADSHWLFDWADVGDFVYVWDPSGKTPSDPAFYGSGGF